ncbi:hypothetical protein RMCBS344292_11198 [Rhizopus microsporus]|nr:hypothetical protein RMCBS344292_11198 [Rhizopus microsporus]
MRGVQFIKYGPTNEALQYKEDIPSPKIKNPHQVLIKIKATGINPVELKVTTGSMKIMTSMIVSLPGILGADFAGVITEKGQQVTDFEVGDEVFGCLPLPLGPNGTYAEYTIADVRHSAMAKKPRDLPFVQAASAGIAVLTAYGGIVKFGKITDQNKSEKRRVLVIGASGGVGSYGVQIAKAINPDNYVVGICSSRNADFVESLGADSVIDYSNAEEYSSFLQDRSEPFDIIFDCVGGDDYYHKLAPLLKRHGVYSTAVGPIKHIGSENISITNLFSTAGKLTYRKLFAPHTYGMILSLPHSNFKTHIAPLFESKALKGMVVDDSNVFSLKDVHKAHEKLATHRVRGKIVLDIEQ